MMVQRDNNPSHLPKNYNTFFVMYVQLFSLKQ